MEILVIVLLVPLAMAVFGIALIANAAETINKAMDDWKKLK